MHEKTLKELIMLKNPKMLPPVLIVGHCGWLIEYVLLALNIPVAFSVDRKSKHNSRLGLNAHRS